MDLGNLTPQDAVVALRSYPRRYGEALAPDEPGAGADELAARPGPDGTSALGVVAEVASTWATLSESLRQVIVSEDPTVADSAPSPGAGPPITTVAAALVELEARSTELAERIDHAPSDSWSRSGSLDTGGSTTALDLVKGAVRAGREGLDRIQAILTALG